MRKRNRVTIYFSGGCISGYIPKKMAQHINALIKNDVEYIKKHPAYHVDVEVFELPTGTKSTKIRLRKFHIAGIVHN